MPDPATVYAAVSAAVSLADRFTAKGDGGLSAMLRSIIQYQQITLEMLHAISDQINTVLSKLDDIDRYMKIQMDLAAAKETYRDIVAATSRFNNLMVVLPGRLAPSERRKFIEDLEQLGDDVGVISSKAIQFPYYEIAIVYQLCVSLHIAILYKTGKPSMVRPVMRNYLDWASKILDPELPNSVAWKAKEEAEIVHGHVGSLEDQWKNNGNVAEWDLITRSITALYHYETEEREEGGENPSRHRYSHDETLPSPYAVVAGYKHILNPTKPMPGTKPEDKQSVREVNLGDPYDYVEDTYRLDGLHQPELVTYKGPTQDLGLVHGFYPDEMEKKIDWETWIKTHPQFSIDLAQAKEKRLADVIAPTNTAYIKAAIYARLVSSVASARSQIETQLRNLGG